HTGHFSCSVVPWWPIFNKLVGKTGQIPVLPTLSPASGNNQLVGVGFQVMIVVTELVADHDQTLGVVGAVVLPGHGDTALQLDALLGHVARGAVDNELGRGQLGAALVAVRVIGQAGGEDGHGSGPLQLADHVYHAVLQNLELADRHAELLRVFKLSKVQEPEVRIAATASPSMAALAPARW